MNPEVLAILNQNGCEIPKEDPPAEPFDTTNPLAGESDFSNFNIRPLYEVAGENPEAQTNEERYIHVRQFYMNKDRTERRSALIQDHLAEFKNILKNGTLEEIKELYKKRHMWRQKAHEIREDGQPICKVESCIHIALPGSEYCMNHIMNDPDQKLFIMCPTCKRPYPVNCECFTCRNNK